jgi:hypothetical protein
MVNFTQVSQQKACIKKSCFFYTHLSSSHFLVTVNKVKLTKFEEKIYNYLHTNFHKWAWEKYTRDLRYVWWAEERSKHLLGHVKITLPITWLFQIITISTSEAFVLSLFCFIYLLKISFHDNWWRKQVQTVKSFKASSKVFTSDNFWNSIVLENVQTKSVLPFILCLFVNSILLYLTTESDGSPHGRENRNRNFHNEFYYYFNYVLVKWKEIQQSNKEPQLRFTM